MLGFLKVARAIYDRLTQDRDILRLKKAAPEIAAQIKAGAQSVTRIVEERFEKKPWDAQPLFVVLGENHFQPAHQLLQMLAIGSLWEKGYGIAIGHERPHDSGLKVPMNNDYGRMVLAHNGFRTSASAYGHDLAAYTWMRRGISVAFNDVARSKADQAPEIRFNMQDQLVQQVMADHDIAITERTGLGEAPAMHLRNRVMVMKAQEHAREQDAEIYIQLCGHSHVGGIREGFLAHGYRAHGYRYDESLTSLFRQQGQAVVGIPIHRDDGEKWSMPQEAMQSEDVAITTLSPSNSFRGYENPQERMWLEAVMNCLEPDFDFDRALTLPDRETYYAGKTEHQARYWKRCRAEAP